MTYRIFAKGRKDEQGNYVGGELVGEFHSEKEAWNTMRDYQFSHPKEFVYMLRDGEEVFTIIKVAGLFHVVDKLTESLCYGVAEKEDEAIKHKAWCEKYHTLGWYLD